MKKISKVILAYALVLVFVLSLASCGGSSATGSKKEVYILNFGDYMSEEALKIFESETGIRVHQDVFEANEEVIPVIESGAKYDVICISDYCIERMLGKDLLLTLDKSKIPNLVNINKEKYEMLSVCDPGNAHAVPYFCGSMGIFFNKNKLDAMGVPFPKSWKELFNPA